MPAPLATTRDGLKIGHTTLYTYTIYHTTTKFIFIHTFTIHYLTLPTQIIANQTLHSLHNTNLN